MDDRRLDLLSEGRITDDVHQVGTLADRHKKDCVDCLGNIRDRTCLGKFNLEKSVKRSVEIDRSETLQKTKVAATSYKKRHS